MTQPAKKISLNFGRVKDVAGIAAATVGHAALKPYRPDAPWQMPGTPEELKREINRTQAFLNDRDYKMRMAEMSEAAEKMDREVDAMDAEVEELKKKFSFGILTGRGRAITRREEELKALEKERDSVREKEQKMRAVHAEARQRLEKMNDRLDTLEGRAPKPKKGFTL